MPQRYAPTLYKARGVPTKQPVCAICIERTRGVTRRVDLGYGVRVALCEAHASHEFLTRRGGRDLVITLHRVWDASGCLTAARSKALDAHLAALRAPAAPDRPKPGSYSWPALRQEAERRFARGATLAATMRDLLRDLASGQARPPSRSTFGRWHAERRWLAAAPAPP